MSFFDPDNTNAYGAILNLDDTTLEALVEIDNGTGSGNFALDTADIKSLGEFCSAIAQDAQRLSNEIDREASSLTGQDRRDVYYDAADALDKVADLTTACVNAVVLMAEYDPEGLAQIQSEFARQLQAAIDQGVIDYEKNARLPSSEDDDSETFDVNPNAQYSGGWVDLTFDEIAARASQGQATTGEQVQEIAQRYLVEQRPNYDIDIGSGVDFYSNTNLPVDLSKINFGTSGTQTNFRPTARTTNMPYWIDYGEGNIQQVSKETYESWYGINSTGVQGTNSVAPGGFNQTSVSYNGGASGTQSYTQGNPTSTSGPAAQLRPGQQYQTITVETGEGSYTIQRPVPVQAPAQQNSLAGPSPTAPVGTLEWQIQNQVGRQKTDVELRAWLATTTFTPEQINKAFPEYSVSDLQSAIDKAKADGRADPLNPKFALGFADTSVTQQFGKYALPKPVRVDAQGNPIYAFQDPARKAAEAIVAADTKLAWERAVREIYDRYNVSDRNFIISSPGADGYPEIQIRLPGGSDISVPTGSYFAGIPRIITGDQFFFSQPRPLAEVETGYFNRVVKITPPLETSVAVQLPTGQNIVVNKDSELARAIQYLGTQPHSIFHRPFAELWAEQGITDPYSDPETVKYAIDYIERVKNRREYLQKNGLTPEPLYWDDPNWPKYVGTTKDAFEEATRALNDPTFRAQLIASQGWDKDQYDSWILRVLNPEEWGRIVAEEERKRGVVAGPSSSGPGTSNYQLSPNGATVTEYNPNITNNNGFANVNIFGTASNSAVSGLPVFGSGATGSNFNQQAVLAALALSSGQFGTNGSLTGTPDGKTPVLVYKLPDGGFELVFPDGTRRTAANQQVADVLLSSYTGPSSGNYGISNSALANFANNNDTTVDSAIAAAAAGFGAGFFAAVPTDPTAALLAQLEAGFGAGPPLQAPAPVTPVGTGTTPAEPPALPVNTGNTTVVAEDPALREFDQLAQRLAAERLAQRQTNDGDATQQTAATDLARTQATLQARYKEPSTSDWRVRLQLAPGAEYLYRASQPGILAPLYDTDGVIFPYVPQIETSYNAVYDPYDLVHSNYRGYFYRGSKVNEIQLRATFTAQDTQEANYLLAVIHFFRSVTKMFYGAKDEFRGTPPPLCYLTGFGSFQFNQHPVLVQSFSYQLPNDVDYIRARQPNNYGTNLYTQRPRTGATSLNPATAGLQRLLGTLTKPPVGAVTTPPAPSANTANTNNLEKATYVPTKLDLSLTLLPYNTRGQVSQTFNMKEFATGALIKGGFW